MNSEERRLYIQNILSGSKKPQKGQYIADKLNVTRQVIVKDIAILRARGTEIIATPEGYMIPQNDRKNFRKILPLMHDRKDIEKELSIIVKYGGIVRDVIIEHPIYGEIKAMLMIQNLYDVENFTTKVNDNSVEPLLSLTRGIHLHTIETDTQEAMDKIIVELKEKEYLVYD